MKYNQKKVILWKPLYTIPLDKNSVSLSFIQTPIYHLHGVQYMITQKLNNISIKHWKNRNCICKNALFSLYSVYILIVIKLIQVFTATITPGLGDKQNCWFFVSNNISISGNLSGRLSHITKNQFNAILDICQLLEFPLGDPCPWPERKIEKRKAIYFSNRKT